MVSKVYDRTFNIWTVNLAWCFYHSVPSHSVQSCFIASHPVIPFLALLALPCCGLSALPCRSWLCFVLLVAVCWWLSVLSPVWGTQGWRSVPPASLQPSPGPWLTLRTAHVAGPPGAPGQGSAPMHPGPPGEWEQVCIQEKQKCLIHKTGFRTWCIESGARFFSWFFFRLWS